MITVEKVSKKQAVLFLILAAACFAGAVFTFLNAQKFLRGGEIAEATITRIDVTYSGDDEDHEVFVEFEVDGERVEGELNTYQSGFYEGKTIRVIYLPDDPHRFTYAKGNHLPPLIFTVIGLAFGFVGVYSLVARPKEKRYDDGTDVTLPPPDGGGDKWDG